MLGQPRADAVTRSTGPTPLPDRWTLTRRKPKVGRLPRQPAPSGRRTAPCTTPVRRTALAAAALLGSVLLTIPSTPATAALAPGPAPTPVPTPTQTSRWEQVNPCIASAGFTAVTLSGTDVVLQGFVQPCAAKPVTSADYFGVGRVTVKAGVASNVSAGNPLRYSSPNGVTGFTTTVVGNGQDVVLCLISGAQKRQACTSVTWRNGVAVVAPLSTAAALVVNLRFVDPYSAGRTDPNCGGCWGG